MHPDDTENMVTTVAPSRTKEYQREDGRKRYAAKREQLLEQQRNRVASETPEQRERRIQYGRKWYEQNREHERERQAQKRSTQTPEQKEQRRQQRRQYYIDNR